MQKSENSTTVTFATISQVALFNHELMGQFSDGFWENSRECGWMVYTDAKVGEEIGVVFDRNYLLEIARKRNVYNNNYLTSGYACNNKLLKECVGDRMKAFAQFAIAFNTSDFSDSFQYFLEEIASLFSNETKTDAEIETGIIKKIEESSKKTESYFVKKYASICEGFAKLFTTENSTEVNESQIKQFVAQMKTVTYTDKMLSKDLSAITKALKIVSHK